VILRLLFLSLLAEEAAAEFVYQRSYGVPGSSSMPLEEWLAFRDAGGWELWERWCWRRAEANSEALGAAGLFTFDENSAGPSNAALRRPDTGRLGGPPPRPVRGTKTYAEFESTSTTLDDLVAAPETSSGSGALDA
jgi:hypothetical protein